MPTRAFIQTLGSPEHRPPPDLQKLVLQDKIDSAETQSASLSRQHLNVCPPKYAVFLFATVSKVLTSLRQHSGKPADRGCVAKS